MYRIIVMLFRFFAGIIDRLDFYLQTKPLTSSLNFLGDFIYAQSFYKLVQDT